MERVTFDTPVGYIVSEDVYVKFSEYYGDGTIYGRADLLTPYGEPVKGAGKTKVDLMDAYVVVSRDVIGSVTGDLIIVTNDPAPAATTPEEATPAPSTEDSVPAPEPVPEPTTEEATTSTDGLYTVTFTLFGFTVTRECAAKIDTVNRKIRHRCCRGRD